MKRILIALIVLVLVAGTGCQGVNPSSATIVAVYTPAATPEVTPALTTYYVVKVEELNASVVFLVSESVTKGDVVIATLSSKGDAVARAKELARTEKKAYPLKLVYWADGAFKFEMVWY